MKTTTLALFVLATAAAAEPLARFDGPLAPENITSVDLEARYACDGDIATVWSPAGRSALRIDLGAPVAVAGWRIAATLTSKGVWEGRSVWKPTPAYEVLASDDGAQWRSLAKPAAGAGRVAVGERVEHRLPRPASTRWIEIRVGQLGGIMDVELLGPDGALLPAWAAAREQAGLRTRLRAVGRQAAYAGKALAWVREHGRPAPSGDPALAAEAAALDAELAAAGDAAGLAGWRERTVALERRAAAAEAAADAWCDLLLRAELAETAAARAAAMGGGAELAAALAALAQDAEPSRQGEFDRRQAELDALWMAWTARTGAGVRRDGRWYVRADGRRLVPFGLNYVQIGLDPSLLRPTLIRSAPAVMEEPRERDFRNLRLWGFNCARLAVRLNLFVLDPRTGEFDPAYAERIRRVLDWSRRYDIQVLVDLHLEYGSPPMCAEQDEAWTQNNIAMQPYYVAGWGLMARLCRGQPHLLGYELIANEPNIADGLQAALRRVHHDPWHDTRPAHEGWLRHLQQRHGGPEGAAAFWGATALHPAENAVLRADPGGPVLDPVALAARVPALDAAAITRVRDYLLASQDIYNRQFEAMAAAIRAHDARAPLVFSVNYDLSRATKAVKPFGADCRLLYDLRPPQAEGITDHYSSAEMARRYPATGQPWFAGENWIFDGSTNDFARLLAAGGGTIGWAHWPHDRHFQAAIGTDRWLAERWRGWAAAAWFSDRMRSGEPARPAVAVVAPLMAYDDAMRRLPRLLEKHDVPHDVLMDEAVARDPALLSRYRAVVVDLDSALPAAVRAAAAASAPALFAGRQTVDGDRRRGPAVGEALQGTFYRPGRLPAPPPAAADPAPQSLAGLWWFRTDPGDAGQAAGWSSATAFEGWDRLPAPGYWETEAIGQSRYATYDGVAWYAREIEVPTILRGRDLVFSAVLDDTDQVWLNGELIGATGHDTPNWWVAPRRYRVPAALVRADRPNLLVIRVVDEKNRGGIAPGLLQLGVPDREERALTWAAGFGVIAAGTAQRVAVGRELPRVEDADLAPGCAVLARFAGGGAAAVRSGAHLLWLGGDGTSFGGEGEVEERVLIAHLREAGVAMTWPATPDSDRLEVHRLDHAILVENRSAQAVTIDPAALAGERGVAWTRVVAPPYRLREPAGPVEIPPGAFAGIVPAR